MRRITHGRIISARSFFVGASATGALLFLVLQSHPCTGLYTGNGPFPTLDFVEPWRCSDVGAYGTFEGLWIDGYEERRFFPNMTAAPSVDPPDTSTSLLIDEAAANMARRMLPQQSGKIKRQYVLIRFRGNELRRMPDWGAIGRSKSYFAVRDIVAIRLLRREY